jgi:hypothetical protein
VEISLSLRRLQVPFGTCEARILQLVHSRLKGTHDKNRNVCTTTQTDSSRDECNDQVIQERRGHQHFYGAELCLMVLDGKPAIRSKWQALGGRLWMFDISKNTQGVRVQDVKIIGIPLENAQLAIRMC